MSEHAPNERDRSLSTDLEGAADATDYRRSAVGRRRSWWGLKKRAKWFLGLRVPNALVRAVAAAFPSLRATGRLPAPAHVREIQGEALGSRFVMLRPDRCVVAKELFWGKGHRPADQDDFAIQLFARLAEVSDVMLDVGAYTGIFTLAGTAVNPKLDAHAFEIVPEVYRALFDNIVRNDVLERVTLHHFGLGAPGTAMRIPARSSDSALPSFYSGRLHFQDGVRVPFRSLDSLVGTIPPGVRVVMKVDVEGTENEVFRYGQSFLARFKPDILCEVLVEVAEAEELTELLEPHGYHFYRVQEAALAGPGALHPHASFRDWFFTTIDPTALSTLEIPVVRLES